jgi:hypothetical protein
MIWPSTGGCRRSPSGEAIAIIKRRYPQASNATEAFFHLFGNAASGADAIENATKSAKFSTQASAKSGVQPPTLLPHHC